jgi:hypothetical protein
MQEQPDLENPKAADLFLAICIPICAIALGVIALMVGLFLGPVALVLPAAGLVLCIWILVHPKSRAIAIGVIVAALFIAASSVPVALMGVDQIRHDLIMSRIQRAVCASQPPAGATVTRCKGQGVANPFNGNQCGYQVDLWLNTELPLGTLSLFYSDPSLLPKSVHQVEAIAPYVVYESPGRTRVEFLAIGDEGYDPRCT